MAESRASRRFGYQALSRVVIDALAQTLVWTLNRAVAAHEELGKDLEATVEARRELGPEFEPELVAAFMERVDGEIDDRLKKLSKKQAKLKRDTSVSIALGSFAFGIPLSAIAGGTGGLAGLVTAWSGIAIVNIAHACIHRRSQ